METSKPLGNCSQQIWICHTFKQILKCCCVLQMRRYNDRAICAITNWTYLSDKTEKLLLGWTVVLSIMWMNYFITCTWLSPIVIICGICLSHNIQFILTNLPRALKTLTWIKKWKKIGNQTSNEWILYFTLFTKPENSLSYFINLILTVTATPWSFILN